MIRLLHLTKNFGDLTVVDDLTLRVGPGEFYGFLGPNGAGKTTTIKMMTGLFTPSSGSIAIGGFDLQHDLMNAKRITGYIPDQPFLYEKLTGREFLYFSAGLYGVPHGETTERIREFADRFEMGEWLDRRTEYYSQGMRQRITIASALLHRPRVLIVDEPMVGLDPRVAQTVKETFRELVRAGSAVFMSTHSLEVAEELCDRIGIIKNGRLAFEDATGAFQVMKDKYNGAFESLFLEMTK